MLQSYILLQGIDIKKNTVSRLSLLVVSTHSLRDAGIAVAFQERGEIFLDRGHYRRAVVDLPR